MKEDRRNALLEFYRGGWNIVPQSGEKFMIRVPGGMVYSEELIASCKNYDSKPEIENITEDFYLEILDYLDEHREETPKSLADWCTRELEIEAGENRRVA